MISRRSWRRKGPREVATEGQGDRTDLLTRRLARATMRSRAGGVAERLNAPVLKTGTGAATARVYDDVHANRTQPTGLRRENEPTPADRVAACWADLDDADRQLVHRVSPELADRLEGLADGRDTG